MLVELNTGDIINLGAVASIKKNETKLVYVLKNNSVFSEAFNTEEEVANRLEELFGFNEVLDVEEYNEALDVARDIQG